MSKKLLAALLAVCMVASLLFVPAAAATFNDVAEDHWAANAIGRWADYDVLGGHGDGTFTPEKSMTRAEFASMLVKMLGLTAKSDKTFDDVSADAWYAEVVSIAVKAGIINGKTAGNFAPNDPVTFEEAAVMMCRAFGLAQTTGGADWSKESIDKLTELGMIGEGADEHLQVGVDCNRAVVAALADAVVAEYVNEDKAEPITGEIKGVVLVVKGAKVEIKDATVAAPIVVESAELTLTNTKAEDVKVSGKDAAIAADEASSVANVTLAGEAPKADIKGDVASVTIAEETTGAVIDAPKADADSIVNNSTEDATVNGETVEGKPEETTDPENPDDGDYNGSVSGGGDVPSKPEDKPYEPGEDPTPDAGHTHNYVKDDTQTVAATCMAEGKEVYNCDVEGCTQKTIEKRLPKAEHTWSAQAEGGNYTCTVNGCGATKPENHEECTEFEEAVLNTATCSQEGTKTKTCKVCGKVTTETIATVPHTEEAIAAVPATCANTGLTAGKKCTVCGKVTEAQTKTDKDPANHPKDAIVDVAKQDATCTEKGHAAGTQCKACQATVTGCEEIDALGHDWTKKDGKCVRCKEECKHEGNAENAQECKTCGKPLGTTNPPEVEHIFTYTQQADGKTHKATSCSCGEADCAELAKVKDKAENCTPGDDGKCSDCKGTVTTTPAEKTCDCGETCTNWNDEKNQCGCGGTDCQCTKPEATEPDPSSK